MRIRTAAALAVAAVLAVSAAGCGGSPGAPGSHTAAAGPSRGTAAPGTSGGTPAATQPLSAPAQQCGLPYAPGKVITVPAADGVRLSAIEAGAGNRGVVLIPELGRSGKCGWWPFAAYLAGRGYRVLAFDHRCTGESGCPPGAAAADLMPDIRGAAAWLRSHGAVRVALAGASQGGSEALIAGAVPPPGVTGLVALSADELTAPLAHSPYPASATAAVPRLRLPVLFAVAAGDPYVSVPDTRRLVARAGSASKRLVVLGAAAGHGWDMVTPGFGAGGPPALSGTVAAFLNGVTA